MVKEANSGGNSSNDIQLKASAHEQSQLNAVGKIEAETVYFGISSELLERLERSGKAESVGTLKAGNAHKSLAHWQGRSEEITQLYQWMLSGNVPLIGIEGIGGTGKSMLASKIYEEIKDFSKRYWADVSTGVTFGELARRVLTEFGSSVPEEELRLVQALVECLQSGRYLLIFDNLESLLQADGQWQSELYRDFFHSWLEFGNKSVVLVTTRERPNLRGFEWLSLKGLKIPEGKALLTELGIKGELEAFVKLVDGHPLLLKLVADLLKDEYPQDPSLERLVDLGLENLQQLLTNPKVVGQHRRENVGIVLVLDASLERLSEGEKTFLQKLSVYRGTFDYGAARFLAAKSSADEVQNELRKLVKRSLLQEKLNRTGQFEFQSVVLEYLRYKGSNHSEAHEQAISYYKSIAKKESWQTIDDVREYLEIFYHYCQLDSYDSAFDSIWTCDDFLSLRGYYSVQLTIYSQLVDKWKQTEERENWRYPAALSVSGNAYHSLGQYNRAIEFHQQWLDIAREIGDRRGEAREIGDRRGEASSLGNLGNAYDSLGQYNRAIDFHQQHLDIAREIGDRRGEANSLGGLGNAYDSLGQYNRAIEFHQQWLDIAREIGDRRGEANSWFNLGLALEKQNRASNAISAYGNACEVYQDLALDSQVEDCNIAIDRLSQSDRPPTPKKARFWRWLNQSSQWVKRLGRWVRNLLSRR